VLARLGGQGDVGLMHVVGRTHTYRASTRGSATAAS
jgi:hypothetical protein